jgi:hypothetical protein
MGHPIGYTFCELNTKLNVFARNAGPQHPPVYQGPRMGGTTGQWQLYCRPVQGKGQSQVEAEVGTGEEGHSANGMWRNSGKG